MREQAEEGGALSDPVIRAKGLALLAAVSLVMGGLALWSLNRRDITV